MQNYPLPKSHFSVNWGGTNIGFTEVSGLNLEMEVLEYREGSNPQHFKRKMPGLQKFGNITLKRGVFKNDNEFYEWYNTVALNKVERRDITVSLLDETHNPIIVWQIANAFIVKLTCTDLKSEVNEVAVESVELAIESFNVQTA